MFGSFTTDSVTELKQRCDSVRLLFKKNKTMTDIERQMQQSAYQYALLILNSPQQFNRETVKRAENIKYAIENFEPTDKREIDLIIRTGGEYFRYIKTTAHKFALKLPKENPFKQDEKDRQLKFF